MKRRLLKFVLAALTIGLLGSCSKINERLDNLDKRVDGIENEKIAAISDQIANINSSIADLGTIRKNIQDLTSTTAAQAQDIKDLQNEDTEIGKTISNLKKADESLNKRIDDLQKYVNDTLKSYGTKEWVNATFSTLAQYEATCDTIAKIDARIGSMDTRLSKSIEDCADSLKTWVNVQLSGYYTIAEMDAKVAEMKAQIDTLRSTTAATADSLKAEIAATKAEIDTVKANIRTEYKSAIETAITALDGKLSNELQTAIDQVNLQINNLTTRINNLQTDVTTLTGRVTALEDMIQSVVIVPAYNDGSVRVDNDSLYIDCIITPATVVERLDTANVVILVNKVKTKAFAGVDTVKIKSGDVFEKDNANGTLSIRVKISDKLPVSADSTITVALNIKNGKSDFTTDFAPITPPVSVSLDKHSIVVPYLSSNKDTTLTATVENSNKGVTWTSSNTNIATVDNSGKVTIKASVYGKDTIVVKTVEGNATDTCIVTVLPAGALKGEFSVSATKKVHFSKGNLVATINDSGAPTAWKFATNQYDYLGEGGANKTIGTAVGDIDLFGWSTASTTYGISTSTSTSSYSGDFVDWGKAYCENNNITPENTWRTLSKDEWTYLFNTRTVNGGTGEGKSFQRATINSDATSVYGMILYPDGYNSQTAVTSYTSTEWESLENAGCVFLPAAGYRNGSNVYVVGGNGRYWFSTALDGSYAYIVNFNSFSFSPNSTGNRNCGFSVRLITESK